MALPNDIARCAGHEGRRICENCARRDPGTGEHVVHTLFQPYFALEGDRGFRFCDGLIERRREEYR